MNYKLPCIEASEDQVEDPLRALSPIHARAEHLLC